MINNICLFFRNTNKIMELENRTDITQANYYQIIKEEKYQKLGLEPCSIEDELNKVHAKAIQKNSS